MTSINDVSHNWWTRKCGGFEVLKYAIPLIISAGSLSLMNFTDRILLIWFSPSAMSASMQGGMLFWSLVSLPMAMAAYTNSFVSQYHGSGNDQRIGPVVWQGIGFGMILAPILWFLGPWAEHLLVIFQHEPEQIRLETEYFRLVLLGAGAVIGSEAAAAFFYGRGKMQIVMGVNIVCVFVNVFLDCAWIYGLFGFPAWGLAGAAVATAASQWFRFFALVTLMFLADRKEKRFCLVSGFKPDIPLFRRLMYFGFGSGMHNFLDASCFAIFILLIGGLGETAHQATTIAFTFNNFTFMPIVGIGIAVTTMVGNQLGNNRSDLASRAVVTSAILGSSYISLFGIAFFVFPHTLLDWFIGGFGQESIGDVRTMSVHLLQFVAVFLLFDGLSIIFAAAIKGAGDTNFVLWVTLIMAPITPILSAIGIYWFGLGVYWCWIVMTGWVFASVIIFFLRFKQGKWKKMRVIERELLHYEV